MESRKRKVLIISYVWPPMEGVGLVRALKFAKYLPESGWEPLVLTVETHGPNPDGRSSAESGAKVFRTQYKDVMGDIRNLFSMLRPGGSSVTRNNIDQKKYDIRKKRRSLIGELISMPDDQIGWYKFAVAEGERILKSEKVDIMMSTSPPETSHLIARALKRKFGVPWVADLRDLWAQDHFRPRPLLKKMVLKHMEKDVLKDADMVITVSEPWAEALRVSLGRGSNKVRVIENGYDPEDFIKMSYRKNERFTISYTGKLHAERQPVGIFFKMLKELVRESLIDKAKIRVNFYALGYDKPDIRQMSEAHGLQDVVFDMGRVGYQRSLDIQASSDALLFVQWKGQMGDGWYSAKLYDYIGSGRPILALAERRGIVADLIGRTSSGIIADDESSLKEALLKLYGEYIQKGSIRYDGDKEEIAKCSRSMRSKALAELLGSVAGETSVSTISQR